MGENFLRKQTENFKHGQDRAFQQFTEANLLSLKPELVGRAYACVPGPQQDVPTPGRDLYVICEPEVLRVCEGNAVIATVDDAESAGLREFMATEAKCAGMLRVTVHEVVEITGEFTIRISEGTSK